MTTAALRWTHPWRIPIPFWLLMAALALQGNFGVAQDASTTTEPSVVVSSSSCSGEGFVGVRLVQNKSDVDVYEIAVAEVTTLAILRDCFPVNTSIRALDVRDNATLSTSAASATTATTRVLIAVDLLFLAGDSETPSESLQLNATALQSELTQRVRETLATDSGLDTATSIAFYTTSSADAATRAPFAVLTEVPSPLTPSGDNASFLLVDLTLRNLLTPANVTQTLLFQARRGIAQFLELPSLLRVVTAEPPRASPTSVLLVTQRLYVVLNDSGAEADLISMADRERIANLLLYGDPTRPITTTDSGSMSPRPSLFLDFVTTDASATRLTPLATTTPTLLPLPYVFSALSVDTYPTGNAPLPAEPSYADRNATLIPATPLAELQARMRKTQRFYYSLDGVAPEYADPDSDPDPDLDTLCALGKFCTHLYWTNSAGTAFWVEGIASVDPVAWDVFANATLCTANTDPTWPSPLIDASSSTTSSNNTASSSLLAAQWTLSSRAASASKQNRIALAIHLRSAVDNTTSLTVEISSDIRSSHQAASTVTSIARRLADPSASSSSTSASSSSPPIFSTDSNLIVTYQSRFRSATQMDLFLEIQRSNATRADTSQPCAHCLHLYDWCTGHPRCALLAKCFFQDALEAEALPVTLLQSPTLDAAVDVTEPLAQCLSSQLELTARTSDVDALLLFTSAMRCQMQRMCAFKKAADYALTGLADRVLLWGATPAMVTVQVPMTITTAVASMALGNETLCSFPVHSQVVALELEELLQRSCRYASYLGHVRVTIAFDAEANTMALTLTFRFLVGVTPTLVVDVPEPVTGANGVVTVDVRQLPSLKLRVDTADFATALPALPPSQPIDVCASKCQRLALDICLRDLRCVAYTDCILRQFVLTADEGSSNSSDVVGGEDEVTEDETVGDVILALFQARDDALGATLGLHAAVTQCHGAVDVQTRAWRQLVNASACFVEHACPISLHLLVPDATTVAAWTLAPAVATQRLLYKQQEVSDPVAMEIPLQVTWQSESEDATPTVVSSSSPFDADALAKKLRGLLEYEGITVRLAADNEGEATVTRIVQWTIEYNHWIGLPPRFIADSEAPTWVLVTMPTLEEPEYLLTMTEPPAPVNTSISDGSSSSSGGSSGSEVGDVTTTYVDLDAATY